MICRIIFMFLLFIAQPSASSCYLHDDVEKGPRQTRIFPHRQMPSDGCHTCTRELFNRIPDLVEASIYYGVLLTAKVADTALGVYYRFFPNKDMN